MSAELTGVELVQTEGNLSGLGCGGGAPPSPPDADANLCGPVSGSAHGSQATFAYQFRYGDYVMTTTISADGARMTGRMSDHGNMAPYPVTWVPLPGDAIWLPPIAFNGTTKESKRYDLLLSSADAGATEYVTGRAYTLLYNHGDENGGIGGDLGTFSYLELSGIGDEAALGVSGTLLAGPVSATEPQLAVSLTIDVQGGEFATVAAITGNGHHFMFRAAVVP